MEDWPYAGTDFSGDPDLPLPEGEDWEEELGKNSIFLMFYIFDFFLLIHVYFLTASIYVYRCWRRATS